MFVVYPAKNSALCLSSQFFETGAVPVLDSSLKWLVSVSVPVSCVLELCLSLSLVSLSLMGFVRACKGVPIPVPCVLEACLSLWGPYGVRAGVRCLSLEPR